MAKIKFGMMMTDARGKLGGQVFSKNRSGAYVRTKVTPVNPRTAFQQSNRSLLGSVSSGWSALTDAQRNAWNGAVEAWQKTNVFGDLTKPTGKNLFTSINKNISELFSPGDTVLLPPSKIEFPSVTITGASFIASSGVFTLGLSSTSENFPAFRVRATGIISSGTSYVKNLLRGLGTAIAVTVGDGLVITNQYRNRFGNVSAGDKVCVEITPAGINGQLGVPFLVFIYAT